jgi:hypothetical protein
MIKLVGIILYLLLVSACCQDVDSLNKENIKLIHRNNQLLVDLKKKEALVGHEIISDLGTKSVNERIEGLRKEEEDLKNKKEFNFLKSFGTIEEYVENSCNNAKIYNLVTKECLIESGLNEKKWLKNHYEFRECIDKRAKSLGAVDIMKE